MINKHKMFECFYILLMTFLSISCARSKDQFLMIYNDSEHTALVQYGEKKYTIDYAVTQPKVIHERGEIAGDVWLIEYSAGDSCPSQYRVFQKNSEGIFRDLGEIGNCNEIGKITKVQGSIFILFPGDEITGRIAGKIIISNDGILTEK